MKKITFIFFILLSITLFSNFEDEYISENPTLYVHIPGNRDKGNVFRIIQDETDFDFYIKLYGVKVTNHKKISNFLQKGEPFEIAFIGNEVVLLIDTTIDKRNGNTYFVELGWAELDCSKNHKNLINKKDSDEEKTTISKEKLLSEFDYQCSLFSKL